MESTNVVNQFDHLICTCKDIFSNKMKDYGASWAIFRWESLVDQIWIKAKRIRTLEEKADKSLIPEGREAEYIGIINYSIIALMKILYKEEIPDSEQIIELGDISIIDEKKVIELYDSIVEQIRNLLIKKNHDYGDAWKQMSIYSITDQIFVKLLRIKSILKNDRKLTISEDIDAQFSDIINYCVFALVKINMK